MIPAKADPQVQEDYLKNEMEPRLAEAQIERLWKFVKKQCLYSKYYSDFTSFKVAITECLDETATKHKSALNSLLTLRFQLFQKAQLDSLPIRSW